MSSLGLWQPDIGVAYALAQGEFNSSSYIRVMDWMAQTAAMTLVQTGRLTVIVQDNGSLHTRRLAKQPSLAQSQAQPQTTKDFFPWTLQTISFHLPAGQVLGILGRTGSGKTTIARLIL